MKQIDCVVFSDEEYEEFLKNKKKIKELLEKIALSGIEISWCYLEEDVERDMKSVSGSYSIYDIIDNFDQYVEDAAWEGDLTISVHGKYEGTKVMVLMWPRKGNFVFKSSDSRVLLDSIINDRQ